MIRFNKLLNRLKPRSNVWRTTLLIGIVVVVSQYLSIAFFWTNLYLPELRQHAHYAAVHIDLLREAEKKAMGDSQALEMHDWVRKATGIEVVRNADDFPKVVDKPFVEIFTTIIERQLSQELNEPVQVYFKFKPQPVFWIHVPSMKDVWVREPLLFFAQYNPWIIIAWIIGVPLLALIAIIVLVRQLNRPLKRLQLAALRVGKGQHSTMLETQSGPMEIRAVNRAFNQMTREIQQAAKDRAFMLAGISHDLRTPLTRLRLEAELSVADEGARQAVVSDIEQMEGVISQFMDYARANTGEEAAETDLSALLASIAARQGSIGRQVVSDIPALAPLWLRPKAMTRAVTNLIDNAAKYAGGEIGLRLSEADGQILIEVSDHGPGIPDGEADRLKRPFTRLEVARTNASGTGLGLAIVDRIARLHDGQLDLLSNPGGGLLVRLTLPARR